MRSTPPFVAATDSSETRAKLSGIASMVVGMMILSGMDAMAKDIVQNGYHPLQLVAIRGWASVALMLVFAGLRGDLRRVRTQRLGLHLARGLLGFLAPYCFFAALQTVPLGQATVIFFAAPIMVTAASGWLLGEHIPRHRWIAVFGGFAGVVIASDVKVGAFESRIGLVVVATLAYVALFVSARYMRNTETTFRLVMYFHLGSALAASVGCPWVWVPLTMKAACLMGIVAFLAVLGHGLLTRALIRSDVALVAPFEYSALLWAMLLGYVFWGEVPGPAVWLGGAVIAASGIFMALAELRVLKMG
jgi:drug/metabolite transporter (DMT)-like permease